MYKPLGYQKKIEPLRKWEVFASGFCIQLWVVFLQVLPWATWSSKCTQSIFNANIQDYDDLLSVHNCIADHKSNLLAGSTILVLGYPIILSHMYFQNRLHETLLAFLNFGHLKWLYNGSWFMVANIYCTIVPALSIFVAYYDWEFADINDTSDDSIILLQMGFAVQYQFLHLLLIIMDIIIIPLGLATAIPWIFQLVILLGCANSQHYKLSDENRVQLITRAIKMPCIKKWSVVIFFVAMIMLVVFSSIGDVFDYAKDGFFSYHGGSQYLETLLFISWELQAVFTMLIALRLDNEMNFLNDNVKSIREQDSLASL